MQHEWRDREIQFIEDFKHDLRRSTRGQGMGIRQISERLTDADPVHVLDVRLHGLHLFNHDHHAIPYKPHFRNFIIKHIICLIRA